MSPQNTLYKPPTPETVFDGFCAAFIDDDISDPSTRELSIEAVKREIETYWRGGGSPFPQEVYNALVEARVSDGRISVQRGDFLKRYINTSFAPEPTTGYLHKHREPLVKAFARTYATSMDSRRIFRIEGDVMNLSGLNAAMEKAYKVHEQGISKKEIAQRKQAAREKANTVIRVMMRILEDHLKECGEVCAVRSGGDEISLYIRSTEVLPQDDSRKDDVTGEAKIGVAIANAQIEMSEFINDAGLRNIPHPKTQGLPGTGIGFGVSKLIDDEGKIYSDTKIRSDLEYQINNLKRFAQAHLGPTLQSQASAIHTGKTTLTSQENGERESTDVNLATLEDALSLPGFQDACQKKEAPPALQELGEDYGAVTPEAARQRRALDALRKMPKGSNPALEKQLLSATVRLTERLDAVTGLPQFSAIETVIVPNFRANNGNRARVVHVDFNNLGGANKLGSWVGDAMSRVFTACVTEAMHEKGLENYIPYLTSQGGGKFTLLLPPRKTTAKTVEQLTTAMEHALTKWGNETLHLSQEEIKASKPLLIEQIQHQLEKRKGGWSKGDKLRHPLGDLVTKWEVDDQRNIKVLDVDMSKLTLNMIKNTKGRRDGSHVITLSTEIDVRKKGAVIGLIDQMEPMSRKGQTKSVEDYYSRHATILREGNYKHLMHYTADKSPQDAPVQPAQDGAGKKLFTARVGRKAAIWPTQMEKDGKTIFVDKIILDNVPDGATPSR